MPMTRQEVMFIFEALRDEVISKFSHIIKLANTKEEMDNVRRRMEQLEQEILSRVRPFEQKNKQAAHNHLE